MTRKSAWRWVTLLLALILIALAINHGLRISRSEQAISLFIQADPGQELISRQQRHETGLSVQLETHSRSATLVPGPIRVDGGESRIRKFWLPVLEAELDPGPVHEVRLGVGLTSADSSGSTRYFWVAFARVEQPGIGDCAAVALAFQPDHFSRRTSVACRAFLLPGIRFEDLELEVDHAPEREWWERLLGAPDFRGTLTIQSRAR